MSAPQPIPLDNDWTFYREITVWDPAVGKHVPAEGIPCSGRFALAVAGAAIHATLEVAMTERAPGKYYGICQGSDMRTHLAALKGKVIYEIIAAGNPGDYLDYRPMIVVPGREIRI